MKRRIFAIVMLLIFSTAMALSFTACGGSSSTTDDYPATADEVSAMEEKEEVEYLGVLQIQRLENIVLEGDHNLPHQVKLYSKATAAYNHPIAIRAKSKYDSEISFSFTIEQGAIKGIFDGIYIESNEKVSGLRSGRINWVGDIQTFTMDIIPRSIDDTVVYKMLFTAGTYSNGMDKVENAYIAFRVNSDL